MTLNEIKTELELLPIEIRFYRYIYFKNLYKNVYPDYFLD